MVIDESSVRAWSDIFAAFDPTMVSWLITLLALEFVSGVALAFKDNVFDWDRLFNIAKKGSWMAMAWGVAFVLSPTASAAVYALAASAAGASIVNNLTSLTGISVSGLVGQLLHRGPGDNKSGA